MLNLLEMIIVLSVVAGVVLINYLIFACSKISPCYIEFDDRKKSEMRLMESYNEGFKKIFCIYIVTSGIIALFTLISFSWFVAMVLLGVQALYTVSAFAVMMWMYIRSVLYWEMDFRKKESIRKASLNCDATCI